MFDTGKVSDFYECRGQVRAQNSKVLDTHTSLSAANSDHQVVDEFKLMRYDQIPRNLPKTRISAWWKEKQHQALKQHRLKSGE